MQIQDYCSQSSKLCTFMLTLSENVRVFLMPPRLKRGGGGKLFLFCLSFCHSLWNFNLANNFWRVSARALIFHMNIPCDKNFPWVPLFFTLWPWPTLEFDPFFENFNLANNFQTVSARALLFDMNIPCDKTIPWVPLVFTLWPWPWSYMLELSFCSSMNMLKSFKFSIIFRIFVHTRSKIGGHIVFFFHSVLNFNLANNFSNMSSIALIFHTNILCGKIFPWVPTFFTLWPWSLTNFLKTFT